MRGKVDKPTEFGAKFSVTLNGDGLASLDHLSREAYHEGKFGQGKGGYRLSYIRAKRADTSVAWINSIFLVMTLLVVLKFFFALWRWGAGFVHRLPPRSRRL